MQQLSIRSDEHKVLVAGAQLCRAHHFVVILENNDLPITFVSRVIRYCPLDDPLRGSDREAGESADSDIRVRGCSSLGRSTNAPRGAPPDSEGAPLVGGRMGRSSAGRRIIRPREAVS